VLLIPTVEHFVSDPRMFLLSLHFFILDSPYFSYTTVALLECWVSMSNHAKSI
jgi:ABC-type microcin C transport system permease subunit YejE